MRKTKSIDASCLDMRSLGDVVNSSKMNMPRAKSEFNLTTTATIERKYKHTQRDTIVSIHLYSYFYNHINKKMQQHRKMIRVWLFVLYIHIWHRVKIN